MTEEIFGVKHSPKVQFNPHTVKTFDDNWKPHYEFGGYDIISKVADAQEYACIEAIRIWAKEKGYDDVLLLDKNKLKEIIKLVLAEYDRLHGED